MPLNTQVVVPAQVKLPGSSLSADDISAALDAGSGTAAQVVRGDGTISALAAADIPSTLNATTFAGDVTLSLGGGVMGPAGNAGYTYFCGGASEGQNNGAYIALSGTGWTGDAAYYCGNNVGAAHSFYDKNGVEQLRVDENGVNILNGLSGALHCAENIYIADTKQIVWAGGAIESVSLATRAASTAFAVCPVATGEAARVELFTDGSDVYAEFQVVASGPTAYLERGNAAYWINTSSPGAAEIGVYVSAGVLYCKPGSSFTGKIASFSKIAKA